VQAFAFEYFFETTAFTYKEKDINILKINRLMKKDLTTKIEFDLMITSTGESF